MSLPRGKRSREHSKLRRTVSVTFSGGAVKPTKLSLPPGDPPEFIRHAGTRWRRVTFTDRTAHYEHDPLFL